jgi:hypothetical protein
MGAAQADDRGAAGGEPRLTRVPPLATHIRDGARVPVFAFNTVDDALGGEIREFMRRGR